MIDEKALEIAIEATTTAGQRGNLRSTPVSRVVVEAAITAYLQALRPGSTGETEGWRELMKELADDLECELQARYPEEARAYPSQAMKFYADMEPVRRARAMLAAKAAEACGVWLGRKPPQPQAGVSPMTAPAAMPSVEPRLRPLTSELDGREVLLFTSYCGDDNPQCSNRRPCPDCLGMSNVFRIKGTATYSRQLAPNWFAADVPISDDQMRRIEKRIRAKIRREDRAKRKAAAIRA